MKMRTRILGKMLNSEVYCLKIAEHGAELVAKMVERMGMPPVVDPLRKLEEYGHENEKKCPWMPSAWNNR